MLRGALWMMCALGLSRSVWAEDSIEMYIHALGIVEEQYLFLDSFDRGEALWMAAEAAEDAIPWLLVHSADDEIILTHGEHGVFAQHRRSIDDMEQLIDALIALERSIRQGPGPIPEDVDLTVSLLSGVGRAMDRHSVVMSKDRLERFNQRIQGRLTGIGAQIGLQENEAVVEQVFWGSPAERGGLLVGDRLVHVDGQSTQGLTPEQIATHIRGENGTSVSVTVVRGEETLSLSFTRAVVRIPNVSWERLPSGVGMVTISSFSEQTNHFLRAALSSLQDEGPLTGVIIDLRGNTGGSMRQACYSVDRFLEGGTVLRTEGRNGEAVRGLMRRFPARVDGDEPDLPIVVLVDRRSASASEILAGNLVLSERAILLGERTHGKGTVQRREILREHADRRVEMKLTVAEYRLTDARVPIESGVGLEPDLWVLPVAFSRSGVALPNPDASDRSTAEIWHVVEHPGWREGVEVPTEDSLAVLAEAVLLAVPPGQNSRQETLNAMYDLLPQFRQQWDAALQQTFAHRGLDWSLSPNERVETPQLDVEVMIVDRPVAGDAVEVRALVHNRGESTAHQVSVHLAAEDGLPWQSLTLPVGMVEPGTTALGSAMVSLPVWSSSRVDLVEPTVHAAWTMPRQLAAVPLSIEGRPPVSVEMQAALQPPARDGGWATLTVNIHNPSDQPLESVVGRLSVSADSGIALQDREQDFGDVAPGQHREVTFAVRSDSTAPMPPIALSVNAESHGALLRMPLDFSFASAIQNTPPQIRTSLSTERGTGPQEIAVTVQDEQRLEDVTVWWDNDKVAWREGNSPALDILLSMDVTPGAHTLTVHATDSQSASTRRTFHVLAISDVTTAAEEEQ